MSDAHYSDRNAHARRGGGIDDHRRRPPLASARPTTGETAAIAGAAPTPRRRIGSSDLRGLPARDQRQRLRLDGRRPRPPRTSSTPTARRAATSSTPPTPTPAGRSEIMIGNWMRASRNRDEHGRRHQGRQERRQPRAQPARDRRAAVDASLRAPAAPTTSTCSTCTSTTRRCRSTRRCSRSTTLIRAGKVRYFGGSDHTGNRLIEARIASAQLGVAPMVALQNHYNLMHRTEYEGDLAHVAAQQHLGVMPRFALASGFLTRQVPHARRPRAQRARRGGRQHLQPSRTCACWPRSTRSRPRTTRRRRRSRSPGC